MRALRIHHEKRVKAKVKTYWTYYWKDPKDEKFQQRITGIIAHSKARCSCPMCGNPRKHFGDRTRQELVHLVDLEEGLNE